MYSFYNHKDKGICLITNIKLNKGTILGPYLIKHGKLIKDCVEIIDGWVESYPLGRYLNHSTKPNLQFKYTEDTISVITSSEIEAGEELTVDYIEIKDILTIPDKIISLKEIAKFKEQSILLENKSLI